MSEEVILHHYNASPYAQKIILALALKGIPFRSLIVPPYPPRTATIPLAGGYRRIPVMQIGADIYCDTALILEELERRFPEPSLMPKDQKGNIDGALEFAYRMWCDKNFFPNAVALLPYESLPPVFLADRAKFSNRSQISVEKAKANRPIARDQVRMSLSTINAQLSDGRSFILDTPRPTTADIHAVMCVWFLRTFPDERKRLEDGSYGDVKKVLEWYQRLYGLIGRPSSLGKPITAEEVLEVARRVRKGVDVVGKSEPDEVGRQIGGLVVVTPDDMGRIPVVGKLVKLDQAEVVVRVENQQLGFETDVHFPRLGFIVVPHSDKKAHL
ncbi:hypothetical protein SpCBS45565_g04494 [Spizellomyces sp. 'palustris']|nr:hypothetical protein SpCBS45565_g04494 [Spizellomyces sp. 'palustris']